MTTTKQHDSDCSTNNRGVPELLGPCDCSAAMSNDNLPLTFDQIEGAFPDGGSSSADGVTVSAQWLHDFAANIWAIKSQRDAVAASGAGVPDIDARNICEIDRSSDQGVTVKFMSARAASKFILELGGLWDTSLLAAAPTPDRATKAEEAAGESMVPAGFQRLETVKFWAGAFADDPQRVAGAMIVKLLNEYAQLRAMLAAAPVTEAPASKPGLEHDDAATAELHAILAQHPPESWAVRNRAFEEAAALCDEHNVCGEAIRALKSKATPAPAPVEALTQEEIDAIADEVGMGSVDYENYPADHWRRFARKILAKRPGRPA
jgi:hypothetical protein